MASKEWVCCVCDEKFEHDFSASEFGECDDPLPYHTTCQQLVRHEANRIISRSGVKMGLFPAALQPVIGSRRLTSPLFIDGLHAMRRALGLGPSPLVYGQGIVEVPCNICSRMNDSGVRVCWSCGNDPGKPRIKDGYKEEETFRL